MAKRIGWLAILIGAACCLYACGDIENNANGKPVASLTVFPGTASGVVGSPETFNVIATFTDGTIGNVHATWSLNGNIGTLLGVGYAEILTPSLAGTGEVHAVFSGLTGIATITVTVAPTPEPNKLVSIEVSPATLDMPVGATQTFSATGLNASGESVAFSPNWSLIGGVGIFTASGTTATLESTSVGQATINCLAGDVVGTVPVTIEGFIANITVEADIYVDQANSTEVFAGATTLTSGYVVASNTRFETYLRFSLGSIPSGVTIESAVLQLFVNSATDSTAYQLYNLNSPFTALTSWSIKPIDGSAIQTTTFTAGQYNSINSADLLNQIRTWYSGGSSVINGIAIRQDSVSNTTAGFLSKENGTNPPVLTVVYK